MEIPSKSSQHYNEHQKPSLEWICSVKTAQPGPYNLSLSSSSPDQLNLNYNMSINKPWKGQDKAFVHFQNDETLVRSKISLRKITSTESDIKQIVMLLIIIFLHTLETRHINLSYAHMNEFNSFSHQLTMKLHKRFTVMTSASLIKIRNQ